MHLHPAPKKFRRDLATLEVYEAIDHNKTRIVNYTMDTPETTIFSANTSCILTPEITDGPYYVEGESIRKDVKEDLYSDGVDLYLEVQYLDVTTCEPVEGVYVDIWNANATGVYRYVLQLDSIYLAHALTIHLQQWHQRQWQRSRRWLQFDIPSWNPSDRL